MARGSKPARGRSSSGHRGGSFGRVLLGLVAGVGLTLLGLAAYFYFGHPPVAVTDKAAMWEPLLTPVPLRARARSEAKPAPFPASEEVFESAAHIYRAQCSECHGTPGREAALGRSMLPRAQQFFTSHDRRATAAQAPGELYWKTAFGIRRSGMPAYNHTLTNTQLWQLSLLLHSAGDQLPDPVLAILTAGVPPLQPTIVQP